MMSPNSINIAMLYDKKKEDKRYNLKLMIVSRSFSLHEKVPHVKTLLRYNNMNSFGQAIDLLHSYYLILS